MIKNMKIVMSFKAFYICVSTAALVHKGNPGAHKTEANPVTCQHSHASNCLLYYEALDYGVSQPKCWYHTWS